MPCQLMIGFFAYAKTLEINVDKEELEGTFMQLFFPFPFPFPFPFSLGG